MELYRCTKESEIATLLTEVAAIKLNQSETKDLVIVVTKLVEQLGTTQSDVKIIKDDIQVLKDKPLSIAGKAFYTIMGVVLTYLINKLLGVI